jgi:hypothetical protein
MKEFLILLLAFTLVFCALFAGCTQPGNLPDMTVNARIYTLDREQTTSGEFTLGSGCVDSQPAYYFYEDNGNGGYKLHSVLASECSIYYDEQNSPYITAVYRDEMGDEAPPTSPFGNIGDTYISIKYGNDSNGKPLYAWMDRVGDAEIHIPPSAKQEVYTP